MIGLGLGEFSLCLEVAGSADSVMWADHGNPAASARLPSADFPGLGTGEIPGMRMIDDTKYGFTSRADHNQDLHSIYASVLGARGSDFDLAMWAFHVGTSKYSSAVD